MKTQAMKLYDAMLTCVIILLVLLILAALGYAVYESGYTRGKVDEQMQQFERERARRVEVDR